MPRARVLVITAGAAALAACSTSAKPPASPATAPAATARPATAGAVAATPPPTTTSPASTSALTGTWSGRYGGAYTGTFRLTWRQSGSTLRGTIKVSSLGGTVSIHGTVNGSTITFGTVGSSTAITYSGTVTGSGMSGRWQIKAPNGTAGGQWSASKL